jgi:RNA polymerase subunit RPABC4/transcription elongation factor Spt4
MAKPKACKRCKAIHTEEKCPKCGSSVNTEMWKGKIEIFNPEESEIANNIKLKEKGVYAVKTE